MIDKRVETFLEIVDAGSFTEAARRLYITQPAVTQQIRSLEEELGVKLFQRAGNRMKPTHAGEAILPYLREMRSLDREMRATLRDRLGVRETFSLGCPALMVRFDPTTLGGLLHLAATAYPTADVRAVALPGPPRDFQMLYDGSVDLAITDLDRDAQRKGAFSFWEMEEVPFFLVCSNEHELVGRKAPLTWDDLNGQTLYLFDELFAYQRWVPEQLRSHPNISVLVRHEATLSTALPLIEMGRGVMLYTIPTPPLPSLKLIPFEFGQRHKVGIAWLKKRQDSQLLSLIDAISSYYAAGKGRVM